MAKTNFCDSQPRPAPAEGTSTARIVTDTLNGPVQADTLDLLAMVGRDDPFVIRALLVAGIGLGVLIRSDGVWCWTDANRLRREVAVREPVGVPDRAACSPEGLVVGAGDRDQPAVQPWNVDPQVRLAAIDAVLGPLLRTRLALAHATGGPPGPVPQPGRAGPRSGTQHGPTDAAGSEPPTRRAGSEPMAPHRPRLTPRESQILSLLCEGHTAEAIARRLDRSPRTVSKHLERLYRKLGTSDRLTTALRAMELGLVSEPVRQA